MPISPLSGTDFSGLLKSELVFGKKFYPPVWCTNIAYIGSGSHKRLALGSRRTKELVPTCLEERIL